LATAGGVVFAGDMEPSLKAFDDRTGELLWRALLDDMPNSGLVTYQVDGKQYVAVVVGMTNFHIGALLADQMRSGSRAESEGGSPPTPARGGAAIWVFAL
jgi:alcohol dehydrogenase (cytochrome c)/methanol dehydrogenase (cytochrome c) subunit 1